MNEDTPQGGTEELDDLEAQLLAQLAAIQAKKKARAEEEARARREQEEMEKEKKRREELEKPITLIVRSLTGGGLVVAAPYREDLVKVAQHTPGRSYKGTDTDGLGLNHIPLEQWAGYLERVSALPNLTVAWAKGVQDELHWYLNAAPLEVTLHPNGRTLLAKPGPRDASGKIWSAVQAIEGIEYSWSDKQWSLPSSEGWRLFEALKDVEGVVWADDASAMVIADVESRMKMDLVAKKQDSDFFDFVTSDGKHPMPFQRVGIEFIAGTGGRCLLGDQTGLGKTWQAVGYAEYRRKERERHIASYVDNGGEQGPEPVPFQTVIVCKAANIPNWLREIKRIAGVDAILCTGGKPEFFALKALVMDRHPYIIINYEAIASRMEVSRDPPAFVTRWDEKKQMNITTEIKDEVYTWSNLITAAKPDLLVMDEAHYMKNPDAHRSKGCRLLATVVPEVLPMTASPVLNRTEELWALLYMLDPVMFKSHDNFLQKYTWNGRAPRNVKQLHEMLKPRFLRRLKKDVQKDLPPINRVTHYVPLSDRALALYDDALKGIWNLIADYDPQAQNRGQTSIMSILAQIVRLKQICAADKVEFTADLATELIDSDGNGGKVLIFSQFKATAVAIAQRLGQDAVCTVRRTATDFVSMDATERDQLFESVRNDPSVRYIVTTAAAQEGHNMEFCNYVIFNDPLWTPEAHNQCEGRAYGRLANPHAIDSYYIIADVDIEKWIMELLGEKLAIIQTAVEGVEMARDTDISIATELIRRMKQETWRR